jgi:hypothetical protein
VASTAERRILSAQRAAKPQVIITGLNRNLDKLVISQNSPKHLTALGLINRGRCAAAAAISRTRETIDNHLSVCAASEMKGYSKEFHPSTNTEGRQGPMPQRTVVSSSGVDPGIRR